MKRVFILLLVGTLSLGGLATLAQASESRSTHTVFVEAATATW